jgi:SNF2 family DNA or RNA helicase
VTPATDRAHRIGQKNTVYSIKLITKGTVEEKALAMQKEKLAWEDVRELLSL